MDAHEPWTWETYLACTPSMHLRMHRELVLQVGERTGVPEGQASVLAVAAEITLELERREAEVSHA